MKIIFFSTLLFLVSCSGGGGSSDPKITGGLSVPQQQAQKLIQNHIQPLQGEQYGISENDIALLKDEGLVTQEELKSLNVVK